MDKPWEKALLFIEEINKGNFLEKLLITILVFIVVLVSIRICFKIINRIFNTEKTEMEPREIRRLTTLNKVVKTFVRASLWTIGILVILGQFMDVASLLAVAGVGTLAIGFGAQGIVEDVMSGFVIVFENQFSVGDYINLDADHYGIVESIGIRTTSIRELNGGLYIIHNGKIDRLTNYSKGDIKAIVDVAVAYEENVEHVINLLDRVCEEVYNNHEALFKGKPEVIGVTRLDPSAMNIRIIADEDASTKVKAETLLRKRIKECFDEEGVEIPYNKSVILTKGESKKNGE
ncbi:MAG: mechanosensitive ion channel family protein [Eubacteriaceae bacterium]